MWRSASTSSRSRGAGASQGTENRRTLCARTCVPSPSTKRPRLARCRSQAVIAVTIGLRVNAVAIAVPSVTRSVDTAAAASGRNGSCCVSAVQTPS